MRRNVAQLLPRWSRECFERAPIICVQDPLRLEVGDRLLDDIPDLVNLGVELLLPVEEVTIDGLLDWREHAIADVAFVAHPVLGTRE